jgi:hypothetical protein
MSTDDLSSRIESAAMGPARVTVDGTTGEARPIPDLIAADRYLSAKRAQAAQRNHCGLTFRKLEPPGAG